MVTENTAGKDAATPAKSAAKKAAKKAARRTKLPGAVKTPGGPKTQTEQDADKAGPRSSALDLAIKQQGQQYVRDGRKLQHEPRRTNSIGLDGRVHSAARDRAEAEERGEKPATPKKAAKKTAKK
jgi:hypothetical protein